MNSTSFTSRFRQLKNEISDVSRIARQAAKSEELRDLRYQVAASCFFESHRVDLNLQLTFSYRQVNHLAAASVQGRVTSSAAHTEANRKINCISSDLADIESAQGCIGEWLRADYHAEWLQSDNAKSLGKGDQPKITHWVTRVKKPTPYPSQLRKAIRKRQLWARQVQSQARHATTAGSSTENYWSSSASD